ncbi:MAG: hypothetical protein IJ167_06980 [Lachnospiraceae bacterium]|nr:hypothetical protein [Lachnospiraceae bacterium]
MGLFDNILKKAGAAVDSKIGGSQFTDAINTALGKKNEAIYGTSEGTTDSSGNAPINNPNQAPAQTQAAPARSNTPEKGIVFDFNKAYTAAYQGGETHADIKADDSTPIMSYKNYKGQDLSFDVPVNFLDFDSGALEISDCFMYTPQEVNDDNYDELYEKYFGKGATLQVVRMSNTVEHAVESYLNSGAVANRDGSKEYISVWEDVNGSCGKMLFKAKVENYYNKVFYFYGFKPAGGSTGAGFAIEYNKDIVGTPLELKLHRIFEAVAKTVNF